MVIAVNSRIGQIIADNETELLSHWVAEQTAAQSWQRSGIPEAELRQQSSEFLHLLKTALQKTVAEHISGAEWEPLKSFLGRLSTTRSMQGFNPSDMAMFIFSFKKPFFAKLRGDITGDSVADEMWRATLLLDGLGLYTMEVFIKAREDIIGRQQQEMLELSTPVVSLAEGVLVLPVIGTLDSERTQIVMESLLQRIVQTGSTVAIIDITGVPTVDTLVAQHLLKTVTAARLMGADCIISGIRPQIAQTIVHLGVELGNVTTKATLSAAFKVALERNGLAITRVKPA